VKTLDGRVAVVTGGASGLGLGIAHACATAGMRVVLADVNTDRLDAAAAQLRAPDVLAVPTDVRDPASVADLARRTVDAFGAAHVVCNNAGVSAIGRQWQTPIDDWNWIVGINLMGVVHGVHAFMPILLEQDEAHVVNTASMAGLLPAPGMGAYVASKHGVVGLSKALRSDLARWPHVGVSVVCPGAMATNLPENVRTLGRPHDAEHVDALRENLAVAMDPIEAGEIVLDAVRENRFWVFPNGAPHVELLERDLDELRAEARRTTKP
jgi:NADP-dependent 3-hydroxy acid dehydrogenase YdfG